jgi:hypothetical protein
VAVCGRSAQAGLSTGHTEIRYYWHDCPPWSEQAVAWIRALRRDDLIRAGGTGELLRQRLRRSGLVARQGAIEEAGGVGGGCVDEFAADGLELLSLGGVEHVDD